MSILTKEVIQKILNDDWLLMDDCEGLENCTVIKELARMALAAMDSEPVAWGNGCDKTVPAALRYLAENERPFGGESRFNAAHLYQLAREIELMAEDPLYRHAQPAPDREHVRREHAAWSQATFGNVGPVGPLKHLSKEALEAAADPSDMSEWADMQFLLWDAQRRAGITDEQITQAMIEKLVVNKQREWPEPKDGEPRLHIKAQPAQVTEREPIAWLNDAYLARGVVDGEAGSEDAGPGYIPVYREAQPAPVVPDAATAIRACLSEFPESARDIVEECADIAENACRSAMLQDEPVTTANKLGNSPVIPDGSVSMLRRWLAFGRGMQNAGSQLPHNLIAETESMLAAAPQEVNHG